MDIGSSVSRRTRSQMDAHYRTLLDMNKKPADLQDNNNISCTIKKNQESAETRHEIDDDDDDDYIESEAKKEQHDDELRLRKRKHIHVAKQKGPRRKAGRPAKKRAIDFVRLLEKELEREINLSVLLPLKFKFEEDDKYSSLKTEWEMEIDTLFHDLELGLWESTHSSNCLLQSTDDEWSSQTDDVDDSIAARCSRGEHDELLDEQIGVICRYCHAVLLDIKHVLPPFCVESPEAEWRRNSEELKSPDQIHELRGSDNCGNLKSSSIPCTGTGTGTVFDLIPKSDKELYPHQLEGFEFMWRNIAGDINMTSLESRLPSDGGRGCILSHDPGTGKTRLTIVFLQTFMSLYPSCRPVIIAPRGVLLTWEQELNKWNSGIHFHNLNDTKLSDQERAFADQDHEAIGHHHHKTTDYIRFIKLLSWIKGGSILGVGYRLFEELAVDHHKFKKILLESPTLVVLDEGHTPRNNHSLMWKVLTKVATRRRIILSGTPFQNNFDELYNTLSLISPRFSDQIMSLMSGAGKVVSRRSKRGGGRRKQSNAARDEWNKLTSNDEGIKKLRSMIEPFVHLHKGSILEKTLPGMRDCLIILRPTPLQQKLLDQNVAHNFLEHDHLASLISVHPWLVAQYPEFSNHKAELKSQQSDPNAGVKTHFLINLIQLSSRINEKVLIFSEFINPLLLLKDLLKSHFDWNEGREVMYIDGDRSMKQRQSLITSFNDRNGEAKVMLASQKACCEGISLVGASRVVLLDVSWNPSVERQAVCRAYRLGQEKMVYVYHLLTSMEVTKYARQREKDRISELIFSPAGEGERPSCNQSVSKDKLLEAMVDHHDPHSMFERIVYQPKESEDLFNKFHS